MITIMKSNGLKIFKPKEQSQIFATRIHEYEIDKRIYLLVYYFLERKTITVYPNWSKYMLEIKVPLQCNINNIESYFYNLIKRHLMVIHSPILKWCWLEMDFYGIHYRCYANPLVMTYKIDTVKKQLYVNPQLTYHKLRQLLSHPLYDYIKSIVESFPVLPVQKIPFTINFVKRRWSHYYPRHKCIVFNEALIHVDTVLIKIIVYQTLCQAMGLNNTSVQKEYLNKLIPDYSFYVRKLNGYKTYLEKNNNELFVQNDNKYQFCAINSLIVPKLKIDLCHE